MASKELEQALSDVGKSLEKVNQAFEKHLQTLEQTDGDAELIDTAGKAVRSLRDSSVMYLTWAYHYAGIPLPGEEEGSQGGPAKPPGRTF
jgi:hypothetical protein